MLRLAILLIGFAVLGWAMYRQFSPTTQRRLGYLVKTNRSSSGGKSHFLFWSFVAFAVICVMAAKI
jgi:predicted signal transduction protein with EAL and GGDEF domain